MTYIKPWVIDSFFSQEDLDIFRRYRDTLLSNKKYVLLKDITREQIEKSMNDWIVDTYLGRIQCSLESGEMPQEMVDIAMRVAKTINPDCEFRYVSFVRYSKLFGNPQLGPHLDPPTSEDFMFDIQLESNTDWDITADVDGSLEHYVLKDNQCLVLDITRQTHWRTPKEFKDGEFLDMLFFSFIDPSIEPPTLEWQVESGLKHMDPYNVELYKIYPQESVDQESTIDIVKENIERFGQFR